MNTVARVMAAANPPFLSPDDTRVSATLSAIMNHEWERLAKQIANSRLLVHDKINVKLICIKKLIVRVNKRSVGLSITISSGSVGATACKACICESYFDSDSNSTCWLSRLGNMRAVLGQATTTDLIRRRCKCGRVTSTIVTGVAGYMQDPSELLVLP